MKITHIVIRISKIEDENLLTKINDYVKELGQKEFHVYSDVCDNIFPTKQDRDNAPNLLIGTFNYIEEDNFFQFLKNLNWQSPEDIQIAIRKPDEDTFTKFNLSEV